jgi:hypothetical protein
MTNKELQKLLSKYPDDIIVVCSGYEGGIMEIDGIPEQIDIVKDINTEWYYGPHESVNNDEDYPNDKERIKALHIGR